MAPCPIHGPTPRSPGGRIPFSWTFVKGTLPYSWTIAVTSVVGFLYGSWLRDLAFFMGPHRENGRGDVWILRLATVVVELEQSTLWSNAKSSR